MAQPLEAPKVAPQPPPVSSAPEAVISQPQPVKVPAPTPVPVPAPVPPPAKPVVSSTSLPKLTQPMPLASRQPLPNVARGVAAAFLEQDDDDTETPDVKTSTHISTSVTTAVTAVPEGYTTAKKVETKRPTASKPPAPVPPPVTSAATEATKLAMTKGDFMTGLSELSYADMVLAAQTQKTVSGLSYDRGDGKGLDRSKARTSESSRQPFSSRRPKLATDSRGRKKLEIGRNVM